MVIMTRGGGEYDVLVVGEVLVEVSSMAPLDVGAQARLGFSGDALNAAAAAAATGATVELLSLVPDDELGDRLVGFLSALGVGTRWVRRTSGQHGVYFAHADGLGRREFVYVRGGSAASQLKPDDLGIAVDLARVVMSSGITCAISESACATVMEAARRAERFIYDPNHRPRLTSARSASHALRRIAPHAEVVVPSWPDEAAALLGPSVTSPEVAAEAALGMGARSVVVTCGPDGALAAGPGRPPTRIPPVIVPADEVVDQTGAGDCLTGTLAGRLARGDDLVDAVRAGVEAAAEVVRHQGGLGGRAVQR